MSAIKEEKIDKSLITEAWHRGILRFKLDSNQQKIYDSIKDAAGGSFYLNKSRRIGGSYLLCVLAIEKCLQKPNAAVKYAAPTAKAVRKIIRPSIQKIVKNCPKELKPKFDKMEGEWVFPNGSTLAIAGCEKEQYENLRGTEADFICLDEVGFMSELEYILSDVLQPQVQDTNGTIVLASTPPRSPAHESRKIAAAHEASGRYWKSVVWDNPRRTKEQHEAFFKKMAEQKGMSLEEFYDSTTFRREYLAEFVSDSERSVIPEWNEAVKEHVTKRAAAKARPKYCDKYVSLDIGWKDGMAALFGYWDFKEAVLVIERELLLFKKTTMEVSGRISEIEKSLWGDEKPFLRISDNNLQTIADFNSHGVTFIPTKKDDKELQVNRTREWVRGYKILIKPNCKGLIAQLGYTIWNNARTSYERDVNGHGDLLDALVYLVRNIRHGHSPYPEGYGALEGFGVDGHPDNELHAAKWMKVLNNHFEPDIEVLN